MMAKRQADERVRRECRARDYAPRVLDFGGSGVFGSRIARLSRLTRTSRSHWRPQSSTPKRLPLRHRRAKARRQVSALKIDRDDNHLAEAAEHWRWSTCHPCRRTVSTVRIMTVAQAAMSGWRALSRLADDRSFRRAIRASGPAGQIQAAASRSPGCQACRHSRPRALSALAENLIAGRRDPHRYHTRQPHAARPRRCRGGARRRRAAERTTQGRRLARVHGWQDLHRRTLKVERGASADGLHIAKCPIRIASWRATPTPNDHLSRRARDLAFEHLGLWLLSFTWWRGMDQESRALRAAPSSGLTGMFRWLGRDRGGMFVEVVGRDAERNWVRRTGHFMPALATGQWCRRYRPPYRKADRRRQSAANRCARAAHRNSLARSNRDSDGRLRHQDRAHARRRSRRHSMSAYWAPSRRSPPRQSRHSHGPRRTAPSTAKPA